MRVWKRIFKDKTSWLKYHRWLIEGFDTRLIDDYPVDTKYTKDEYYTANSFSDSITRFWSSSVMFV